MLLTRLRVSSSLKQVIRGYETYKKHSQMSLTDKGRRDCSMQLQLMTLLQTKNPVEQNNLMIKVAKEYFVNKIYSPELASLIYLKLTKDPKSFGTTAIRTLTSFLHTCDYLTSDELVKLFKVIDNEIVPNLLRATEKDYVSSIFIVKHLIILNHYPDKMIKNILIENKIKNLYRLQSISLPQVIALLRDTISVEKKNEYGYGLPILNEYLTSSFYKANNMSDLANTYSQLDVKKKALVEVYWAIKKIYQEQAFSKNVLSFSSFPDIFVMPTTKFDPSLITNLDIDYDMKNADCTVILLNHRPILLMSIKLKARLYKKLGYNVKIYNTPFLPKNLNEYFAFDLSIKIDR